MIAAKAHQEEELVETIGMEEGGVDLVALVCRANDEPILLDVRAVHFHQDLVEDTVSRTVCIAQGSTTHCRDRVQPVDKCPYRGIEEHGYVWYAM